MKAKKTENLKEGNATSSARIRENQRRSRTRRKEYIQHLEQRLWSFEKLGVAATQEVQKAGRKVATENGLLRSLLILHGVTKTQIEEYLELRRGSTSSILSQYPSAVSQTSTTSHLPTITIDPLPDFNSSPAASPHHDISISPPEIKTIGTRCPPKRGVGMHTNTLNVHEFSAERAAALSSLNTETVSEAQQLGGVQDTGQFTSCVAAARIVASIRNYADSRDVRSELGCDSGSNCMVKNMSIFDILDK